MEQTAIKVTQVRKVYKLYDTPAARLKDALGLSRKQNYREHEALKGVDLEIKRGETVGIIGTNGSGKSTLLKIIRGVIRHDSRICRYWRICKPASKDLFQRHVCASGLCSGDKY